MKHIGQLRYESLYYPMFISLCLRQNRDFNFFNYAIKLLVGLVDLIIIDAIYVGALDGLYVANFLWTKDWGAL